MECYERGVLTKQDTDGIELTFGNSQAVVELVEKIARREGFGEILCGGAARAAVKVGKGEEYVMHVKKQDFPMHEPRVKHGLGLSYAVSPTGADHMHAIHDVSYVNPTPRMMQLGVLEGVPALELSPRKVRLALYEILLSTLYNDLVICNAPRIPYRFDIKRIETAISGSTGWDITSWELMKAAERSVTLARVFNLLEGLSAEDDVLPDRLFTELDRSPGSLPLDKKDFWEAVSLFYEMLGWDALNGVPTRGKLEELDLGWTWECINKI
jgi:aldehyde:ferredoxin oxidoreductase